MTLLQLIVLILVIGFVFGGWRYAGPRGGGISLVGVILLLIVLRIFGLI